MNLAWLAALPALVALAAYANALGNGFVWDDPIILDRQLVVFDSLRDVLLTPRDIPQFSPDYYRPLTVASYLFDLWWGGGGPFAFHFSLVVAHAACASLVALLATQLLGDRAPARLGALAAGVLFAVHPVHTESVAWAAGRSDVLATLFVLAALVVHGAAAASWRRSAATGGLALLSLGAKEVGAALYPLLVVRAIVVDSASSPAKGNRHPARRGDGAALGLLRDYAGFAAAFVLYLALRTASLGAVVGQQPGEAAPTASLPSLFWATAAYLRELVWPFPLNAFIDVVPRDALSVVVFVAYLAAVVAALRSRRSVGGTPLFAVLWIAVTLLPSLAIVWKIPEVPMAERYLYLPSVGLCLLLASLVAHAVATRGRLVVAPVAALAVAAFAATVARNPVWHDDVALWEDTVQKASVSGMAWRSLGTAYQQRGRADEAGSAFERALTLRNSPRGLQVIHNNLGTLAMTRGEYAAALRSYEQALQANPNAADTLYNVGLARFFAGGQTATAAAAAIPLYRRAQALSPHDPDIDAALGQAYAAAGDRPRAIQSLEAALRKGVQPQTATGVRSMLEELRATTP
jgi:tetratricopeptide (TPR) repeat protein